MSFHPRDFSISLDWDLATPEDATKTPSALIPSMDAIIQRVQLQQSQERAHQFQVELQVMHGAYQAVSQSNYQMAQQSILARQARYEPAYFLTECTPSRSAVLRDAPGSAGSFFRNILGL